MLVLKAEYFKACIDLPSRKHTYIMLTPSNPTFIQENWGLQGYTLFFLFLLKTIDCGYSLEPPRRGGSNECPQSMFWAEIWKISEFLYEIFPFFGCKIFNIFEQACFRNDYHDLYLVGFPCEKKFAVWSAPSLSANRMIVYCRVYLC